MAVFWLNKQNVYARTEEDDPDDRGAYGDLPRMGIVVVEWDTFPKLTATLPKMAIGEGHDDGWLFAADHQARYISVIFPWRDYDAWLTSVRSCQTGSGASENEAP